jgi:hypothetical protein
MVMVFVEFRFLVRKQNNGHTISVVSPIYVPMQSGWKIRYHIFGGSPMYMFPYI